MCECQGSKSLYNFFQNYIAYRVQYPAKNSFITYVLCKKVEEKFSAAFEKTLLSKVLFVTFKYIKANEKK